MVKDKYFIMVYSSIYLIIFNNYFLILGDSLYENK